MQIKRLILPISLIPIVLFILFLFSLEEHKYQGRTLDQWLALAQEPETRSNAFVAIRAMGPKIIPDLLSMLQKEDPSLTKEEMKLLAKQGVFEEEKTPAIQIRRQAVYGFEALGPQAKRAIPALTKLLMNTNISDQVAWSLSAIGPEASDALLSALNNESSALRITAVQLLSQMAQTNVELKVIPQIKALLNDPNPSVRAVAGSALKQLNQKR